MSRYFNPGLLIIFVMIPALMEFSASPGLCQESLKASPDFRVRIYPVSQALTQLPMPISFNGVSGSSEASTPTEVVDGPTTQIQRRSGESGSISTGLTRIRAYLFQYIQLGTSAISVPNMNDYIPAGIEKDNAGKEYSLEFQADIEDLSGALLFVMKI